MGKVTTPSEFDRKLVSMNLTNVRRLIVKLYMGGYKMGDTPMPVFVDGSPGIGKTFTVYAAAREIGKLLEEEVEVQCQLTSCLEPTDITGVPTPIAEGGETVFTRYLPPEWAWVCSKEYETFRRLSEPKFKAPPMILFFDDLPAAHFQTQTAFFKGVHEGMWGHLRQRDNVMVIGAGNRVEDNAGANDMPTALANRFVHVHAELTTDDWLVWANSEEGNIHPYVIGYIRQNKDSLNEFDSDVANRAEKAFASARTWEMISKMLWAGEIVKDDDILFARVVMGTVGRGHGNEFLAYMRNTTSVVPPDEIVKSPKKARIPTAKNLDALHATIASLEHHIKQNTKDWEAGVIYASREEMIPDVGVLLAQTISEVLKRMPAKSRTKAMSSPVLTDLYDRYEDLMDAI